MDETPKIPEGWKIADTTPSGVHRLLPEDYRPVSLPHNRHHSAAPQYVVKIWVIAGFIFAGILVFYGFYLVAG